MASAGQLDRHRLAITCPKCGHETTRTPKQLRADAGLHCQRCGADLAEQVAEKSRPIEADNRR
jgi:transcription elongation factor Elf1